MVQFSRTALEVLLDAVKKSGLENDRCLRLAPAGGDFVLTIDNPSGQDTAIEHEGRRVLLLSREVRESLEGAVVEVKEDDGAFQFIVRKQAEAA